MSTHKPHINSTTHILPNGRADSLLLNSRYGHRRRSTTPIGRPIPSNAAHLMNTIEGDLGAEEDPRLSIFRELYNKSEARLNELLGGTEGNTSGGHAGALEGESRENDEAVEEAPVPKPLAPTKRKINEDDYDESDDDDEDESPNVSPLKFKSTLPAVTLTPSATIMRRGLSASSTPVSNRGTSSIAGKTTEEARKKLEADKKATEESARRSFHTLFYTLENDRDAMLEQKKLEESERQVDAEMGANGIIVTNANGASMGAAHQGTLSQANLGASNLAFKNLIREIDANRDRVPASDTELRGLFSEVRKGRGKWKSDDRIGQEDLYEAAETVLNLLRGNIEHSSVFLQRVNKKEAPDYYNGKSLRSS